MQKGERRPGARRRLAGVGLARAVIGLPLAGLTLLPVLSFVGSQTSPLARLAVMAMLTGTLIRPGQALLVCAGLSPIAGPLGAILGSSLSLAEPLVLAFLGGWLLRETLRPGPEDAVVQAIVSPALLFAAAVAASCAVQLVVLQVFVDYPAPFLGRVIAFLSRGYFVDRGPFGPVTAGALLLEGAALFVAVVTLTRRDPLLAGMVARMVAVGGVGVAALNINRLLTVSLRAGMFLKALEHNLGVIRISSAFRDLNAAGSYLAMALLLSGSFIGRGWTIAALLILGGLWLAGSRAALAAVPFAGLLMVAVSARLRRQSTLRIALLSVASLVLFFFAAVRFSSNSTSRLTSTPLNVRTELAGTSLRMFGAHPTFGVGVGRFYPLSTEFSTPELLRMYPRENAHNNFLQILAELGIVGFGSFLWILVAVARRVWPAFAAGRESLMLVGAVGGLTAFLLTCLSGHPLLIAEVAYAFWLVLGAAAGLAGEAAVAVEQQPVGKQFSSWPLLVGASTLLLVLSVPIRGWQMLAEADLERAAIGFSGWQTDSEGVRFRWMVDRAQFYARTNAGILRLALKLESAGSHESSEVEVYLDGRLANRVRLEGSVWREVPFVVPRAGSKLRFWRVELRVPAAQAGNGISRGVAPRSLPRIEVAWPDATGSTY